MHERELERAAAELGARKRRTRDTAVIGLGALVAAVVALTLSPSLAVALLLGAGVELLVSGAAFLGRRELISRLALDPRAYVLPEVERYGLQVARRRERLASWLAEVVAEAPRGGTFYLGDRVSRYAGDLLALARELGAPGAAVRPPSAVACQRLLTHAIESPLYNPRLPADELALTLARIRAGIETG